MIVNSNPRRKKAERDAQLLFLGLEDFWCPQGISNARHVATLAGLEPSQSNTTTSGENGQTASISDAGMD
jgi:hypothetical protein